MESDGDGTPRFGAMHAPSPTASERAGSVYAPPADDSYAVFVIGASGDLAHKKTYPSLYELYIKGLLPANATIIGYARSPMSDDDFRKTIIGKLKGGTDEQKSAFVAMCIYRNGGYDDKQAFARVRAVQLLWLRNGDEGAVRA